MKKIREWLFNRNLRVLALCNFVLAAISSLIAVIFWVFEFVWLTFIFLEFVSFYLAIEENKYLLKKEVSLVSITLSGFAFVFFNSMCILDYVFDKYTDSIIDSIIFFVIKIVIALYVTLNINSIATE